MTLTYAHQVRPESDPLPFELRQAEVRVKVWPPDYEIDFCDTYQVVDASGKALSDAEINIETALQLQEIGASLNTEATFKGQMAKLQR